MYPFVLVFFILQKVSKDGLHRKKWKKMKDKRQKQKFGLLKKGIITSISAHLLFDTCANTPSILVVTQR